MRVVGVVFVLALGCGSPPAAQSGRTSSPLGEGEQTHAVTLELSAAPGPADPNGEDNNLPRSAGPALAQLTSARRARFVPLPPPPATAHPLVCDLVSFRGALYVSHAVKPIDRTGARVHRFTATGPSRGSWELAFDWNRGGTPDAQWARGGEGFTRLRVIDDRLVVPDADSPGPESFGASDAFVENLVLRSHPDGSFPSLAVVPEGALIQPWSFHAFDAIRYRGLTVVSGGVVNPEPHATTRFPAGLWTGPPNARVLELSRIFGEGFGVVRSTYMHRFAGRLYIGLQNNQRRIRFDLAILSGAASDPTTPMELVRISKRGGYVTRSFASDDSTLYWLGELPRKKRGVLYRSRDGARFEQLALPPNAGAPQDIVLAGDSAYLLTRNGLFVSRKEGDFELLAPAPPSDPFGKRNTLCGARMTPYGDHLVASSTRDGSLFQVVPDDG